jgi:periplasmic divalent cation tolerance protein
MASGMSLATKATFSNFRFRFDMVARVGRERHEAWRLAQVQENDKPVLIYTTFPSTESADLAGSGLVEAGLAACVNIIAGMTSIYRWEGKIARDSETVMIIKTRNSLAEAVMAKLEGLHPYDTPAFLVVPVVGGSGGYIGWLMQETAAQSD